MTTTSSRAVPPAARLRPSDLAGLASIDRVRPGLRIWVSSQSSGGQWFYVTGILRPDTHVPEIDTAVLVGFPAAERYLGFDGHPSEIYVRTVDTQAVATRVDSLLGYQADPENPNQVDVSQPSAALTAQADAKGALDTLFLGLGAVALLVGAIGVANIMVISVLERRQEIGLRRALGATRGQIRAQFLAEAILLSLAGGAVGVLIGSAATALYAGAHGEAVVIPPDAWAGGLAAAVVIGALAGLLPAIRAARLSPARSLWSILGRSGGVSLVSRRRAGLRTDHRLELGGVGIEARLPGTRVRPAPTAPRSRPARRR
jgi:putative ABC transport system permease protein